MPYHTHTYTINKGFTLIELLVVIVIIGILATISVSTFNGYFKSANYASSISDAKQRENNFLADCFASGVNCEKYTINENFEKVDPATNIPIGWRVFWTNVPFSANKIKMISGKVTRFTAKGALGYTAANWFGINFPKLPDLGSNYRAFIVARKVSGTGDFQLGNAWHAAYSNPLSEKFEFYEIPFTTRTAIENATTSWHWLIFGGSNPGDVFEIAYFSIYRDRL